MACPRPTGKGTYLNRTPTHPAGRQKQTRPPLAVASAALFASLTSTAAPADTPLGLYVGAAIGTSLSRTEDISELSNRTLRFHQDDVAWKGFIGIQPLPLLGVELAYTDFENASGRPPSSVIFGYFKDNSKSTATTLFGVGYLPLPSRFLKLYGKLGVARLHSETQVSYSPPSCPIGFDCSLPTTVHKDERTTDFAYGAGAQVSFGSLGMRAEYERINSSGGKPDLLSVGVSWNF